MESSEGSLFYVSACFIEIDICEYYGIIGEIIIFCNALQILFDRIVNFSTVTNMHLRVRSFVIIRGSTPCRKIVPCTLGRMDVMGRWSTNNRYDLLQYSYLFALSLKQPIFKQLLKYRFKRAYKPKSIHILFTKPCDLLIYE